MKDKSENMGEREEGFEEPKGVNDAWAVNLKMVVERAQRLEEERQGQCNRIIEQSIATQARINEIAMQSLQAFTNSMDERQKDSRIQAVRKEHYCRRPDGRA